MGGHQKAGFAPQGAVWGQGLTGEDVQGRSRQPAVPEVVDEGGYVDRGEVVEKAAAREVLEETGLQVSITGLLGIFSEEGHPVVLAAFNAREVGGEAKPGPEVSELGFFLLDELPPLAFPRDPIILEAWKKSR